MSEPTDMVRGADDAARRMRSQARWYPAFVAAFGVITALIVALVPVLSVSWTAPLSIAALVLVSGVTLWRYQQPVRPVSDARIAVWVFTWVVLAIVVVWFVGPAVAGTSVALWALLGLVQALPPFVEAALWTLRSRA